jgi:hypothetical protein
LSERCGIQADAADARACADAGGTPGYPGARPGHSRGLLGAPQALREGRTGTASVESVGRIRAQVGLRIDSSLTRRFCPSLK